MEWMRCNACWLKVRAKQSLFHLTQCGHVYCEKCILKAEERCFQCGTVGTISLPLKEPLNPQISHFFTRPAELMEKVIQAEQFQEFQLALCLKRADASDSKYQSLKEAYWVSSENVKKVLQKYYKLKTTVNLLQKDKNSVGPSGVPTLSQFRTPPTPLNNPKFSQQGLYSHNATDSAKRSNEVFRVPTAKRAPRSAGYFSDSSTSSGSTNMMTTPHSHYSRY